MIEVSKYKIPKFEEFERVHVAGKEPEIRFAARIAVTYHEFAYHQMINFCEVNNHFFEQNLEDNDPEINTYLNKAWADAYSMYALLRTVIEAVRKLNETLLGKATIEDHYKSRIKEIVDIANNMVKHPMFNGENSSAYLPTSLGRGGEIDMQKWIDKTSPSSSIEINPEKDFYAVCGYLEYVAEKYQS